MGAMITAEEADHRAAAGVIEATEDNEIQIVCETIPFFKSVSFGIWVFAGSRDETDEKSGLFHFLEHLVFKGTKTRDTAGIAMEIDELGGRIDAFTSREVTCYSGHVIASRLERAFDIVADIMLNSVFPENEMELERQVILEEIRSVEDNPPDYIHDQLYPAMWNGHPLGNLIAGTAESVKSITRDDLLGLRERFYRPPQILVTACGMVDMGRVKRLVSKYFGYLAPAKVERILIKPEFSSGVRVIAKPIEQVHLLLAAEGPPVCSDKRHALSILNIILGGGVSSRLFQTVREQRGLAYSIYSFIDQYLEAGLFGVYAACSPAVVELLWRTMMDEIKKITDIPPTHEEINRAKIQSIDNLVIAQESLGVRLSQIAHQTLYYGKVCSIYEMISDIRKVTEREVGELAGELLGEMDLAVLALGPVGEAQIQFEKR